MHLRKEKIEIPSLVVNGLRSLYSVTLENAFETITVYYQIHLLALQIQFAMLMQKKKWEKRIK